MAGLKVVLIMAFLIVGFRAEAVTDRVVVQGLNKPWAVVNGPDGNIWVTEKAGVIKIYSRAFVLQKVLKGFPDLTMVGSEGGLLDLAFHPRFFENGWIYVAYSVADGRGEFFTRVNRFTYRGVFLSEHKVIFNGPSSPHSTHFGARLVFDDQGFLLASFGERREMYKAQDMATVHGKIIRVTDGGGVPSSNPFVQTPGAMREIYSLGHRNPQGLAIHPVSRKLYDSEHGPTVYDAPEGGDEVNEIVAGSNYGWPQYHHRLTGPGMTAPIAEYTPAVAPSGMEFYTGSLISNWKNDLFIATLRGRHVIRLRIDAQGKVLEQQKLLENKYGRLRDVSNAPDGSLLVISEDGRMIQLR